MMKDINRPRHLDPNLSIKEKEKCYEAELKAIDDYRKRENAPNKVPGYPGAYYCTADIDYTKYQRGYPEPLD